MTFARVWPDDRARAWLLRKAADMIERGAHGSSFRVQTLANDATSGVPSCESEYGFRYLCALALSIDADGADADCAVAEVYGDAPAPQSACDSCEFVYGVGHVAAPCKHQQATTTRTASGWMVVSRRDSDPVEVFPFAEEAEARAFYDEASVQWSEVYLCRVVAGPGDAISGRGTSAGGAAAPATPRPAEHVAEEWIAEESALLLNIDYRTVRASITRLIERSRAEGAAAERAQSVDAALIAELRAEERLDANPHAGGSSDPLAVRLGNAGVRADELETRGVRHVAEVLFGVAEKSHAETKRLRVLVDELEKAAREALEGMYRLRDVAMDIELGRQRTAFWAAYEDVKAALHRFGAAQTKAGGQPR